jgi:hypothetical protein
LALLLVSLDLKLNPITNPAGEFKWAAGEKAIGNCHDDVVSSLISHHLTNHGFPALFIRGLDAGLAKIVGA